MLRMFSRLSGAQGRLLRDGTFWWTAFAGLDLIEPGFCCSWAVAAGKGVDWMLRTPGANRTRVPESSERLGEEEEGWVVVVGVSVAAVRVSVRKLSSSGQKRFAGAAMWRARLQ